MKYQTLKMDCLINFLKDLFEIYGIFHIMVYQDIDSSVHFFKLGNQSLLKYLHFVRFFVLNEKHLCYDGTTTKPLKAIIEWHMLS